MIVVSGLPGAGKSTVATSLADEFNATLLSKDVIEAALWRSNVRRDQNSFWVSHEIMNALATDAVRRGHHVIIDSVATTEEVRRDWRNLARRGGAAFVVIVCTCSDEAVHRSRLGGRDRGIAGWPELEWGDVEQVARRFEPWPDVHLTVDSIDDPHSNLTVAARFVRDALGDSP